MEPAAAESLPEGPSEEEFCAALRNGLVLCKVLNRVNPGAVPKVRVRCTSNLGTKCDYFSFC